MRTNLELQMWFLEFIKAKIALETALKKLEKETDKPGEYVRIFNLFSDKIVDTYHAHLFGESDKPKSKTPIKFEVIK